MASNSSCGGRPARQVSVPSVAGHSGPSWSGDFPCQPLAWDGTAADLSERWLLDRRCFLLAGLLGLGGCQSWSLSKWGRSKTAAELDGKGTVYVSDLARVWGAAPARIDGVGMVSELAGTGSAPPPSKFRDELTEEMKTQQVPEPNKLLSANWTSLVILQGVLPAGSRKGTPFDVFVGLEPGSGTTSLEGGYLMPARMTPQRTVGSGRVLHGRLAGTVTGPVVVNALFEPDHRAGLVTGVVPGGGRMAIDRPIGFQTKEEFRTIRESLAVAGAINGRFNYFENSQRQPVATAKNDSTIDLEIPEIYRSNVNRYLHVVRNVAVGESAADQISRLELLEQQLRDPTTAEAASLRLEAIGENGIAILERALRHPDSKVRFMAGMALAYQGQASACEELGRLAQEQWAFRWHALTALSAMPDPLARQQLRQLLHVPSAETRYGAVRSLVSRQEGEDDVDVESFGEGSGGSENFVVKTVYSTAEPLIHVARFKRPEIVVFNPDQFVKAGSLFVVSGWTIKCPQAGVVEIQQYRMEGGDRTVRCGHAVPEVLRTLGKMNATYTLVVRWLKQAAEEKSLEGRLVINALPKSNRAYNATSGSLAVPEMFQGELDSHSGDEPEDGELAEAGGSMASSSDDETPAPAKSTFLGRLTKWPSRS